MFSGAAGSQPGGRQWYITDLDQASGDPVISLSSSDSGAIANLHASGSPILDDDSLSATHRLPSGHEDSDLPVLDLRTAREKLYDLLSELQLLGSLEEVNDGSLDGYQGLLFNPSTEDIFFFTLENDSNGVPSRVSINKDPQPRNQLMVTAVNEARPAFDRLTIADTIPFDYLPESLWISFCQAMGEAKPSGTTKVLNTLNDKQRVKFAYIGFNPVDQRITGRSGIDGRVFFTGRVPKTFLADTEVVNLMEDQVLEDQPQITAFLVGKDGKKDTRVVLPQSVAIGFWRGLKRELNKYTPGKHQVKQLLQTARDVRPSDRRSGYFTSKSEMYEYSFQDDKLSVKNSSSELVGDSLDYIFVPISFRKAMHHKVSRIVKEPAVAT